MEGQIEGSYCALSACSILDSASGLINSKSEAVSAAKLLCVSDVGVGLLPTTARTILFVVLK